jgi:flagellar FliJ protein
MTNSSALDTLIELAVSATDEAARKLGQAIRSCDEAQAKLAMLIQYREDYAARFQTGMAKGLSVAGYQNFRVFMEKLDAAIAGQQQIVAANEHRVTQDRGVWRDNECRRMSYDTLATRAQTEKRRVDERRQQKATDEHAARRTGKKIF